MKDNTDLDNVRSNETQTKVISPFDEIDVSLDMDKDMIS